MSSNPYRAGREQPRSAQRQVGIVDDMVRQFADPYAFVRELVQNAIDAGCRRIRVEVSLDETGRAQTSVEDDGCGMTQQIIESYLLTAFASSKEKGEGKIGKYGVGFLSVLGLDPEEVVVETWRSDEAYLARLYTDHSFVLEQAALREGSGTRVMLLRTMDSQAFERHTTAVRDALRRWCRHASVPLTLVSAPRNGAHVQERIDEPFTIAAPVVVTAQDGDEEVVVGTVAGCSLLPGAAGAPEGDGSFAGFYNRGLTLLETGEAFPRLHGLRWKVMSPALRHTLSRDNVKRDDAFERMLGKVRGLARLALPAEIRVRSREVAEAAARDGWLPAHQAVLAAAAAHLPAGTVRLPLVEPFRGDSTASVEAILDAHDKGEPCLVAPGRDALTAVLAKRGRVIVRSEHGPACGTPFNNQVIAKLLRPLGVVEAHDRYVLATVTVPSDREELGFCEAVRAALLSVGEAFAGARWVTGIPYAVTSLRVDEANPGPLLVPRSEATAGSREGARANQVLVLRRDDPAVLAALVRVRCGYGELAALLIARIVLLELRGAIPPQANERLLTASVEAAGRLPGGAR